MREPREFSYPSSDGSHTVHAMEWLPQGQPRAVVQIVHGVAEYVGRYDHVARFLTERGFLVCGEDHLGHGKTVDDGKYGYFGPRGGWDLVVRDIRRLRELQGEKYPGVPYVMLGHSMGSFLTRTYLIRWPGTVDGAVLSGTGQEPAPLVALGKALAGGLCLLRGGDSVSPLVNAMSLGAYNKKFAPNRTGADWISRDEAVVDTYLKDPSAMTSSRLSSLNISCRPSGYSFTDTSRQPAFRNIRTTFSTPLPIAPTGSRSPDRK